MFNLGGPEIIMIAIVALIVFGPDRIPEFARVAARAYREFRRITTEVQSTVHETMTELQHETGISEEYKPTLSPAQMEFASPPAPPPATMPTDAAAAETSVPMPESPACEAETAEPIPQGAPPAEDPQSPILGEAVEEKPSA